MIDLYQNILQGQLTYTAPTAQSLTDPIGIGAVGGSGTRLLLQMMNEAGVAMASPINKAGDAYEWPPWKNLLSEAMLARHDRDILMPNILHAYERLLIQRQRNLDLHGRAGWKVPGTFHWLQDLGKFFPGFQYIHLVRHGLDMAYSGNQNQAKNWAASLGIELKFNAQGKVLPRSMLEYWLRANETAHAIAAEAMPGRMLVVRFEQLCASPMEELGRLLDFLALDVPDETRLHLASLVKRPASVGRYQQRNWQQDFTADQLARLEALGYQA
jgi:Sulfotransferase family